MNILEVKERLEIIKSKIIEKCDNLPDGYKGKKEFLENSFRYIEQFDMGDCSDEVLQSEFKILKALLNHEITKILAHNTGYHNETIRR